MSISRCCKCHKKAYRMMDGKHYCNKCKPPPRTVIHAVEDLKPCELDMAHPDWKPKPKKKEGFWDKVARWFGDSNCGCGLH